MKISTKGRYGLRALLDLAVHSENEEVVTVLSIAKRMDISKNYLEQVFSALRKAEIVKGVKGPQGGYLLNVELDKLFVGQVLRVLEGSLFEVEVPTSKEDVVAQCIYKKVWQVIDDKINEVVDHISLADLVKDYKRSQKENIMFYI